MNKKGFTLIELLAVIVILAVIALIAVPIILGIIEDAKKSATEESARTYLHAIEQQTVINKMAEGRTSITDGLYDLPMEEVTVSGATPTGGWVLIEEGQVTNYSIVIDGYVITIGEEITKGNTPAEKPSTKSTTYIAYTLGQLVYFDPVSDTKCDENSTSTTCYKWRVIETEDNTSEDKITLQMDHNLVELSAWSPSENVTGPTTALNALNVATAKWERVDNLNYTYDTTASANNYRTYNCTNGNCILNSVAVAGISKARMITIEEITNITNTNSAVAETAISKTWNLASTNNYYFSGIKYNLGASTKGTGNIDLLWLVENTYAYVNSGSTANTYGVDNYGY